MFYKFKILLILILFPIIPIGCTKNTLNTGITFIDFSKCDPVAGCTVTFPYTPVSPQKSSSKSSIPLTAGQSDWNIETITINQDFGILKKDTKQFLPLPNFTPLTATTTFGPNYRAEQRSPWMQNTLSCNVTTQTGDICNLDVQGKSSNCQVTCTGLYPFATNFMLDGTLNGQPVNQTFIVTSNGTLKGTGDNTTQCGWNENTTNKTITTYQRIFDCYAKVQDSAGFGGNNFNWPNNTVNCSIIDPSCNADLNWFLVYSPSEDPNDRFWLSPVITADNPAVGENEQMTLPPPRYYNIDTNVFIAGWKMSSIIGQRLLWSGTSQSLLNGGQTFNFFEANGKNPYDFGSNEAGYNYYPPLSASTIAQQNTSSINSEAPPLCDVNKGVCAWIYNPNSTLPNVEKIDEFFKNEYDNVASSFSVCDRVNNPGQTIPMLLSEEAFLGTSVPYTQQEVYEWQMPSYPMIMTLTGGNRGFCEIGGFGYQENQRVFCLSVLADAPTYLGSRAIDSIPNFLNNLFWSSSVLGTFNGWFFYGDGSGGSMGNDYLYSGLGVRCASFAW